MLANLVFSEQVANFLNTELGATIPESAPNWKSIPIDDSQKKPPSRTNKTTVPAYTIEEIQEITQFIKWLDSLFE